ncbi:MAG: hypothetical protein QOC99_396, partial [Acidobacteriota bacterium]|nr:hypothetical protein [Acidobacteriota bacterium]
MPRRLKVRSYAKLFIIFPVLICAGILTSNLWSVGAQSVLPEAVVLPGDLGAFPAPESQANPSIAKGANGYLAVWADARTAFAADRGVSIGFSGPYDGTGLGSMIDIYAARLDANGQVIDTTPIIVSQAQYSQGFPKVGWNGQNYLVTWYTTREDDRFKSDSRAARVSPAGVVLDTTPITIRQDIAGSEWPNNVIEDGAGDWVVVWDGFIPQSNGSRGVFIERVANDGTVLDPGGRLVYDHQSQFMGNSDLARAGDRYLLTISDVGPPDAVLGILLDSNFNQLRNGPETLSQAGYKPRVASNGDTWLVVWGDDLRNSSIGGVHATRVSRVGDPVGAPISVRSNSGTSPSAPQVAWDGTNWQVVYNTTFNTATQTYINDGSDIYLTRVATDGTVLDANGIVVKAATGSQDTPAVTPGVDGGAQVVWHDANPADDIRGARVSSTGAASADVAVSLGAPRQSKPHMVAGANGFLSVFRSETSGSARILAQRLDQAGAPLDQEPFVVSDGTANNNPSVAWNGSVYLVVWEAVTQTGKKVYGRRVSSGGTTLDAAPFLIATGEMPDAAALNGTFIVPYVQQVTVQLRYTKAVLVSGAGSVVGQPQTLETGFNFQPRAAAYGNRWFVVWEFHANHDDAPGVIHGAFVEADGTKQPAFVVGDTPGRSDAQPQLAVASTTTALVVWTNGDIIGRRINPDGSSDDPVSGAPPIAAAPELQSAPSVAWDGNQYLVDWIDQRNEGYPQQPRGDIYGARVAVTGVKFEEFALANSPLPEETPFVVATGGVTVFSYAKFYDQAPYAAHRITLRTVNFPAPNLGSAPAAPSNLVATADSNTGVKLTWTDNSANELGFKVEMSSDGTTWNQIKLSPAGTTSEANIAVGSTTQYYFRVRAYNAAGDSVYTNVASPPVAQVSAPQYGTTYLDPANIAISANAIDPEGIAKVEFLARRDVETNYTLLSTDTDAPYGFTWSNVAHGSYYLAVRATDTQGSSTLSSEVAIAVLAKPSVQFTSPADGATFTQPAAITLTASAQTLNNRSDETIERLDFYEGTRWIGQGQSQVFGGPWSFNWTNVPVGTHTLTAQATSSFGLTGISAPVRITVNPQTQPTPDNNLKPVVTLTAPANNASFASGAAVNVTATASDPDGTIARVEFRADGQLIEADASAPYGVTMSLTGGTHALTATAVDNNGGSNTSAPVTVMVERTTSTQITNANWDFQSEFGPSVVTQFGPPVDKELADDFDITGDIDRVVVYGARDGIGSAPAAVRGAFVRFYAWSGGNPGALEDEMYLAAGDAGLVYNAATAGTFDITLPHAFRSTGKHFVSVQLVVEGENSYWYWQSAHSGSPQNAPVQMRDNYAGGVWGAVPASFGSSNFDAAMAIYGTLTSPSTLTSVVPQTATRSGLVTITGTNFGESQGAGRLLIDKQSAIVVKWTNTQIVAYVPEGSRLGAVPVEVSTGAGTSNALSINVTDRQADGRIRWRATVFGDFTYDRAAVAPAGSPEPGAVYVNVGGLVYAWSPTGALKWVTRPGASGTLSVGPDGTIYTAASARLNATTVRAAIIALNAADGTEKWRLVDSTAYTLRAGPAVGPDGKIYAVFEAGQYNTVGINPDGTVAWSRNEPLGRAPYYTPQITFGHTLPRLYFYAYTSLVGYDFNGTRVFNSTNGCCDAPAVAPDENLRVLARSLNANDGSIIYTFPAFGQGPMQTADAGPDNTHYVIENYYRLYAINPTGTEKWHYDAKNLDNSFGTFGDPVVSPSNTSVLIGGRTNFGEAGFFAAVNPATGQQLWKFVLPDEPGLTDYNAKVIPTNHPVFTPDGNTAYAASDIAGASDHCYFYALNTTPDNVPINQPPVTTVTNPLPNSNLGKGAINVTATVKDDGAIDRVEFYYNHLGVQTLIG